MKLKFSACCILIVALIVPTHASAQTTTTSIPTYIPQQTMRIGSRGPAVTALQRGLKQFGYYTHPTITGYFGPITELAVNKFQNAYRTKILAPANLPRPTGIAGPRTINQLNSLLLKTTIATHQTDASTQPEPIISSPKPRCKSGGCASRNNVNVGGISGPETPTDTPLPEPDDPFIFWQIVGGSASSTADRNISAWLKSRGWIQAVEESIQPFVDWGVKRIVVGNPFGTIPGQQMEFDQYIHAQEAGLDWITDDFVEAWRPITDQGVEVIAYLGVMSSDPNFVNNPNWEQRFWTSIQPVLDAGMNVAFDAITHDSVDSIAYQAALLAQGQGMKVYIEPRPQKNQPHWHSFPIISVDSFWYRSDPDVFADSAVWAASNSQLTGEIIRLVTAPPPGETWNDLSWAQGFIHDVINDGHTSAFGTSFWLIQNYTYEEIVNPPIVVRTEEPEQRAFITRAYENILDLVRTIIEKIKGLFNFL